MIPVREIPGLVAFLYRKNTLPYRDGWRRSRDRGVMITPAAAGSIGLAFPSLRSPTRSSVVRRANEESSRYRPLDRSDRFLVATGHLLGLTPPTPRRRQPGVQAASQKIPRGPGPPF